MQISRHWRLNSQRYRLEGIRYNNGDVSLQNRPVVMDVRVQEPAAPKAVKVTVGK
jgi:hypothetical protein